jgi:hypothetical protein
MMHYVNVLCMGNTTSNCVCNAGYVRETYSPVVQTRTNVITVPTCAVLMEYVLIIPARTAVNAIRDTAIRRLLADVWILMNV